jgi:hypothetical protein
MIRAEKLPITDRDQDRRIDFKQDWLAHARALAVEEYGEKMVALFDLRVGSNYSLRVLARIFDVAPSTVHDQTNKIRKFFKLQASARFEGHDERKCL